MIVIDGSTEEGGGAMLRQALSFSILTKKPFRIINIRSNRDKPGLKRQHLKAVELARDVSGGKATGLFLGSQEVEFFPGSNMKGKSLKADIGTAGSITLLLQSIILPCAFSKETFRVTITGGTDVKWSPTSDYFKEVFLPHLKEYADISFNVIKRGYYPKGGGVAELVVKSKSTLEGLKPLKMARTGKIIRLKGIINSSKDLKETDFNDRIINGAKAMLAGIGVIEFSSSYQESLSTGSGFTIASTREGHGFDKQAWMGSSGVNSKDMPAEDLCDFTCKEFLGALESSASCDKHLADQLIPLLAFSKGVISVEEVTKHAKSNIYVASFFTNSRFFVDEKQKIVRCD